MDLGTIFLICAVAGGTILVIRLILMIIGLDHGDADFSSADGGMDAGHPGDLLGDGGHMDVSNFLSIQSIAGFFTMFGLVGMGLDKANVADGWSLLGALAAGIFTAWATGMIFFSMRKLQSEGNMQIENAIGKTGTVYLTIPEKGTGVVNVSFQGALRNMDAISAGGDKIPTGSMIEVIGVKAGKILVVRETASES